MIMSGTMRVFSSEDWQNRGVCKGFWVSYHVMLVMIEHPG